VHVPRRAQAPPNLVYSERYGLVVRIPSRRKPSHIYSLVWVPVSGWVHADNNCPARKPCWHKKEARNIMTNLTIVKGDHSQVEIRPVLLVAYDAAAISKGVDPELVASWAYNLGNTGGKGVTIRGAEEGSRAMASMGEILRVETCEMVSQDEREALFTATCRRYVINPESGQEIALDQQTRGKRVSKYEMRADGSGEYFNKNWYEVGLVKASRNAVLAMMPGNVKTALLKAGLDAKAELGSGQRTQQQGRPQQQQRTQQQQQRPAAASDAPAPSDGEPGVPDASIDLGGIRKTIEDILVTLKSEWGSRDFAILQAEMGQFNPDGKGIFNPKSVPESKAAEALAYLQKRRGDA